GEGTAIGHVAVDDGRRAGHHRVDDRAAVLAAAVHLDAGFGPAHLLHPLELAGAAVAAAKVLVQRHGKSLHRLGPVRDEPGAVLGVVLTGPGAELPQPLRYLEPHACAP